MEVPEQNSSTSSIFYNWMGNQDRETVYVTTPTPVADLELYSLMESHGVDYYDKPVDSSTQIMYLLLSYLLPVVIMVGAMMFLFRGVGGKGGMGGLGGVGKANAKVYVEKKTGVTFRDVADRTRPRSRWRRSSTSSTTPRSTRPSAQDCPRALCWWALPVPARLCLPRPWPARPTSPSSPSPARTLWRCSWAWGPAVSVTCSRRPPRWRPASSSSTRSTPSANPATAAASAAATTSGSRP